MNFFNFKFYTDTKINNINNATIILIYFTFITAISFSSLIYAYITINKFGIADPNNNLIIEKLQFRYGDLINNLVKNWDYSSDIFGVKFFLARLPIFPIVLSLTIKISSNVYFIFFFKNFIFFSIYFLMSFLSLKYTSKNLLSLICVLFFSIIIPYNFHVALNIFFADCIVYLILPSLFLMLNSNNKFKYLFISFLLIILYLTKTSMTFIVICLPLFIFILEKNNLKKKIIPILSMLIVVLGWGTFGLYKTGKFPIFKSTITLNSQSLYYINCNPQFIKNFPYKSVDILLPLDIDYSHYEDEWEVFNDFNDKAKNDCATKNSFFKDLPKKLKFIFFNINKDNVNPDENGNFNNPIVFSYILNKLFFNIAFLIAFFSILKNITNIVLLRDLDKYKIDIYYLIIVLLNLLPHLAAWATSKHLVAIQLMSMIYIYLKVERNLFRKIFKSN